MSKSIYIHGFHSLESLLKSNPESVLKVFIQTKREDKRVLSILNDLTNHKISVSKIDKNKLDNLVKSESHQGIVSEIIPPSFPGERALIEDIKNSSIKPLMLILDSIQDPRNLGACLRTANAAGVDYVIINKDGSAPVNALVYKASAGAINSLRIYQVTNLVRTIKAVQKEGLWVIGLDGKASTTIYNVNLADSTAIVMGSEGKGIRLLIKKTCDQLVTIPMSGDVESLNVSVATGITLFESMRQRKTN
tara:strand:- start:250 stop:996 length:747 start_codon:yes stop_codon:yes gene_type:complete